MNIGAENESALLAEVEAAIQTNDAMGEGRHKLILRNQIPVVIDVRPNNTRWGWSTGKVYLRPYRVFKPHWETKPHPDAGATLLLSIGVYPKTIGLAVLHIDNEFAAEWRQARG